MYGDVKEFVSDYLHCVVSRTGEKIPRPIGKALHGSTPNEVVHMDFLFMGKAATSDMKYVLIIRDDLSSYIWLRPSVAATSDCATEALAT